MTPEPDLSDRIRRLERGQRFYKLYSLALTAALAIVATSALRPHSLQADAPADRVLRARGLVIEDADGRERILLGAPVPPARNRVRTDPARVREVWGKRFPKEYAEWYKGYRHAANGLLILDEKGFDRIALGDPVPDPNIGRRIAPSTGVVFNDEEGFERTGYGLLNVDGRHRVVLGMDSAHGQEGLTVALVDQGQVGVTVGDGKRIAFLGSAPAQERLAGAAAPFHGLLVRGPDGIRLLANAAGGK